MPCNKHKFRSKIDAIAAAATAVKKSKTGILQAYKCHSCNAWHLTSQIKMGE